MFLGPQHGRSDGGGRGSRRMEGGGGGGRDGAVMGLSRGRSFPWLGR